MSSQPISTATPAARAGDSALGPVSGARGRRPSRWVKLVTDWGPVLAVGVILLAIWQAVPALGWLSADTISEPSRVVVRLGQALAGRPMYGATMWANSGHTVFAVLIGYLIGAVAGMLIGYVLARVAFVAEVFEPYLRALAAIPKITLVPLLVLIFGLGVRSEAANVVLMTFVIVVFSTFSAVAGVREEYVNIARVMGARQLTITFRIVLSAALPAVMGGLRAGVPAAFVGAITSEFIASSQGLGWFMQQATAQFDPTGLFTGLVFVMVFVLVMVGLIDLLQFSTVKWKRR